MASSSELGKPLFLSPEYSEKHPSDYLEELVERMPTGVAGEGRAVLSAESIGSPNTSDNFYFLRSPFTYLLGTLWSS